MEIIEYIPKYDEQIKDLLVDLQNYLIDIDDWHTQIIYPNYREDYFKYEIDLIKMQEGKIYLALENNMIVGLIIGKVSEKDQIDKLTNDCAKIGDIIELIVKKDYRGCAGSRLSSHAEHDLRSASAIFRDIGYGSCPGG